ncbi:hypothetical protein HHK36_000177 [Tetracentron sinense]|uniref:CCT domain-containing protein n=1 Tax=Tetracentron sinense TaxID=13715 RepID=A0A835DTS1_TETSI|nr:hypothetical protein HHK36_000177 [Tetracentron sinense]
MSSDLLLDLDGYILPSNVDLQFLYEPFPILPIDNIQAISDDPNQQFPAAQSPSDTNPLSSSPPSKQINNLSLYSNTHLPIAANSADGLPDFSGLDALGVKSEEEYCYVCFDSSRSPSFPANIYGIENAIGVLQRSLSSQSFDAKRSCTFFQPAFNSLLESPNFQTQFMESPENSEFAGSMRKVCSTGDLQRMKRAQSGRGFSSNPLAAEISLIEESSFKVGRYNAEERKANLVGVINLFLSVLSEQYACRKTLADSRLRVRGRFARNDETGEIPKVSGFNRNEEDEDELWVIFFSFPCFFTGFEKLDKNNAASIELRKTMISFLREEEDEQMLHLVA